ncbi:unsaturated glucuronyl hydrolase-like [Oppia nitens]|uniref:unsaturated glucuronyl hydrolase-like n=1 Tax=Oppia nitens TaxID=1686743 RepID=UPI0023DBF129|nr:unsaturated glucuronyl hydrolase-like [Oppia nitens]
MLLKVIYFIQILIPFVLTINITDIVNYSVRQYNELSKSIIIGKEYPTEGIPLSYKWNCTEPVKNQWTSGFYPGVLWHLYKYTNDNKWRQLAIKATDSLSENQMRTDNIDIGFIIMCSYGKGYEFTKNSSYPQVIVNAANSLAKRFNYNIGCTQSWDNTPNEFVVIADNMMDLEVLFEGWRISKNKTLLDMAVSHTIQTIKYHLREDYSHYQAVAFSDTNATIIRKFTAQGYADWSCWAQSQAWLVTGFTIAYRYSKLDYILNAAEGVSNYFIDNSPPDGIPYWDFDVPHDSNHTYIPRDSSAASIAASGLIELYGYTNNTKYLNAFNKIINSLYSDNYRADAVFQVAIL